MRRPSSTIAGTSASSAWRTLATDVNLEHHRRDREWQRIDLAHGDAPIPTPGRVDGDRDLARHQRRRRAEGLRGALLVLAQPIHRRAHENARALVYPQVHLVDVFRRALAERLGLKREGQ